MSEQDNIFYCRLCASLRPKPELLFIRKDGGITRKIYELVLESFSLDLDNAFPSSVCSNCWLQASSMYDLYEKALHAQDILRNINQANIQINSMNDDSSTTIKTEEIIIDSIYLKRENEVEFGKANYSDLDNIQEYWSDCKTDDEIVNDKWNDPLNSIVQDFAKHDARNQNNENIHNTTKTINKQIEVVSQEIISDTEDILPTSPEIEEKTRNNMLTDKSNKLYERLYKKFMDWRTTKNITLFSEHVLIDYVEEIQHKMKPTTLWIHFSAIKSILKIKHNIDISKYLKVYALLKRISSGYIGKKSEIFSADQIKTFLDEAPDNKFLCSKVALIFGVTGACRRHELHDLRVENVQDTNELIIVNVIETKQPRTFIITGNNYNICKKYMKLRPVNCPSPNFFLNYFDGRCTVQNIGINKLGSMGKQIATYLKLPHANLYTGHCFRRTSGSILVNSGGDITTLNRHGYRKSTAVTQSL